MQLVGAAFILIAVLVSPAVAGLDEKDLQQVMDSFYLPERPVLTAGQRYKFLSSETRRQIDEKQWDQMYSQQPRTISSASILGKVKIGETTYGVVSVTETVQGKKAVNTATWMLEGGGWRRLILPRHAATVAAFLNKGNYEAAVDEAEAWRREDPFSVQAYRAVVVCKARTGNALLEEAMDGLISDLLAINPDDTDSLLLAVTYTEDAGAARAYLDRLKDTAVYDKAVDAYVANIRDRERADVHAVAEEEKVIQQLVILSDLGNLADFRQLAAESGLRERLTAYLDGLDDERAAGKAGKLGLAFCRAGDRMAASKWLQYGKRRNPGNADIRQLETTLEKDAR